MSDNTVLGPCFHCHATCTEEDYCFGCNTLICGPCSPYYDGPSNRDHQPEDHLLCFGDVDDDRALTCRRITGEFEHKFVFCGAPAVHSAYCLEHLHVVIDERARASKPS